MLKKIETFMSYPSGSGIMFLLVVGFMVAYISLFCEKIDVDAAEPLPYDKNWVAVSTKEWTGEDAAFSYYTTQSAGTAEPIINRHYDFECQQSCVVIAAYNTVSETYKAFAICLKDELTTSPMKSGSAYWDNEAALSTVGANNYNMINAFNDWYTVFPEWTNSDYWVTPLYDTTGVAANRYCNVKYDLVANSASDLRTFLENQKWDPKPLPSERKMPHFYLKVTSPALVQNIEYTITWDTTDSLVDDESKFGINVYLSQRQSNTGFEGMNFRGKKPIKQTDINPCPLNSTAFTFTYRDLMQMTNEASWLDQSFFIYLRVVDQNNTPVNNKWVNFHVARMYEIVGSNSQTEGEDGEISEPESLTTYEDGVLNYDDDRPVGDNTNEDGEQNSNGSSVSPQASESGINNYDPTNPDSENFNYGGSVKNIGENLKILVSSVSGIPSILVTLLSFLPSWLITLISVSLGLFVVIGTIKAILK